MTVVETHDARIKSAIVKPIVPKSVQVKGTTTIPSKARNASTQMVSLTEMEDKISNEKIIQNATKTVVAGTSRESGKLRLKLTLGGRRKPPRAIPVESELKTSQSLDRNDKRIKQALSREKNESSLQKQESLLGNGKMNGQTAFRSVAKSASGTRLSISISKPASASQKVLPKGDDVPSLKGIEQAESSTGTLSSKELGPHCVSKPTSNLTKKIHSGTLRNNAFKESVGELSERKRGLKQKIDLTRKTSRESLKSVTSKQYYEGKIQNTIKRESPALRHDSKNSNLNVSAGRGEDNCIMPDVVMSWFGGEKKKSFSGLGGKSKDKKINRTTTTGKLKERKVGPTPSSSNLDSNHNQNARKSKEDECFRTIIQGQHENEKQNRDKIVLG